MNAIELKKQLPSGSINEISKRTGINKATVSMVLRGLTKSRNYQVIIKATAEYLAEYKAKEIEVNQELNKVLNQPINTISL